MKSTIECRPSYALAYLSLAYRETVFVEAGAMVAMSDGISVVASTGGGLARAAVRKVVGQETFFMGRYTADVEGAWVAVAPKYPGDMTEVAVDAQSTLFVQSGSLIAHSEGVENDTRYAGARQIVLREGATTVKLSGEGSAVIGAYGGLQRFSLGEGERLVVDTGHLVAWGQDVQLRIGPLGGAVAAVATGEGLVAVLTGTGPANTVWVQSRAESQLRNWLLPNRTQNTGT